MKHDSGEVEVKGNAEAFPLTSFSRKSGIRVIKKFIITLYTGY